MTSVTRPLVVSTVVPTGSCWPTFSVRKPFLPGSLIFTVPPEGWALTFLPATGGGSGLAKPLTTTTWSPLPNVEKRKSPVTGSMNAPSAPLSPVMNVRRVETIGSPFASTA